MPDARDCMRGGYVACVRQNRETISFETRGKQHRDRNGPAEIACDEIFLKDLNNVFCNVSDVGDRWTRCPVETRCHQMHRLSADLQIMKSCAPK